MLGADDTGLGDRSGYEATQRGVTRSSLPWLLAALRPGRRDCMIALMHRRIFLVTVAGGVLVATHTREGP